MILRFWIGCVLWLGTQSVFADAIQVVDSRGKTIILEKPAQRVIALSPHLAENLFAIGAGDILVGAVEYADYPVAAKKIPRVGGFNSLSAESILALQPDLIIAWGTGNGAAIVQQLESLSLPVYVDEPGDLNSIAVSLRNLSALAGTAEQGGKLADDFLARLDGLRNAEINQPVRVLYQIWHEPLQTVSGDHLISEVIQLCGGRNIFSDSALLAPKVSVEAVLARDPELIIASGADKNRPDWLDNWQQWPALAAVKNNQLHHINPDFLQRHTPRILQGAEQMCELIRQVRS